MTVEWLQGSPCIKCPGNERLCSNEDSTLQYNSLTCNLLIDWISKPKPKQVGRPKAQRPRQVGLGQCCKNCGSDNVVGRGKREYKDFSIQTFSCYSCSRWFSVRN